MENNIPTAKEFIEINSENYSLIDIEGIMIKFTKLHVEAALKAANKNVFIDDDYDIEGNCTSIINENSILNAYPLTNIK